MEFEPSFFSHLNSPHSTGEADDLFLEFPMADDFLEFSDDIIGGDISGQLPFINNAIHSSCASLAQLNSKTMEEEDPVVEWLREIEEKELEKEKEEVTGGGKRRKRKRKRRREVKRRCMHCATHKTPQWREGPKGPKTLCNACGVRYRSGRLYPEYRPANSPTFVSFLHSNSYKKVVQMRAAYNNPQHRFSHSSASAVQ